jgi:hypothetical protein
MIEIPTKVLGTTRSPDGSQQGEIAGLVINQSTPDGRYPILDIEQSIDWARKGLLYTDPLGARRAQVEAIDANRDGHYDSVRSVPDGTKVNNLLSLPIYNTQTKQWWPCAPTP